MAGEEEGKPGYRLAAWKSMIPNDLLGSSFPQELEH
jgi:hypothetical protein